MALKPEQVVAILLAAALQFGCGAAPKPAAPPASAVRPALSLKQLMEWVIDPAADAVWDSVKTIITEQGTKEIAPHESSNLLMMQPRAQDQGEWSAAARRLAETAEKALEAAESKDAAGVFAAGGEIDDVCSACHRRYAPQLNADPGAR
ncbi:MAG: cytochrome c [Betaproteobacteria bacterium]|nr:MAG: cytochrome c [Betaproteobacteria bacterium]